MQMTWSTPLAVSSWNFSWNLNDGYEIEARVIRLEEAKGVEGLGDLRKSFFSHGALRSLSKPPTYSGKCELLQVGVKAPGTPKMTTFLPLKESVLRF